ncbi:MAG: hypothetical protein KAJ51_13315 [Thermoplasmata archaeon]|nr:hypothetical protein [Thermoplasmata archaeon]
MGEEPSDFLDSTSKKLAKIEKKIKEMKYNIVIMSFYSDLKLIENTLISYQASGIEIDNSLLEKIEKFKTLLQSDNNLPKLGKKFIELTEEFYNLRRKLFDPDLVDTDNEPIQTKAHESNKKKSIDYLSAYT